MSFLGLDPTAVRQLAAQMNHAASEIQSISASLTNQLGSTQWVGPDRERFVSDNVDSHGYEAVVDVRHGKYVEATANAIDVIGAGVDPSGGDITQAPDAGGTNSAAPWLVQHGIDVISAEGTVGHVAAGAVDHGLKGAIGGLAE